MLTPMEKKALEPKMKTLHVIWAALIASLLIYAALAHLVLAELTVETLGAGELRIMAIIFGGLAVIEAGAAFWLRSRLTRAGVVRFFTARQRPLQPTPMDQAAGVYTVGLIICLALLESPGIFGFVLFMLSHDYTLFYLFLTPSLALMLLARPRREELAVVFEQIKKDAQA